MKTLVKFFGGMALVVAMVCVCGVCTSCESSDGAVMNTPKHKKAKVVKSNYKVKGNNRTNSNTYHAY